MIGKMTNALKITMRGMLAVLAGATLVGIGSALAVGGGTAPRASHTARPARKGSPRSAFAVLTHKTARIAAVGHGVLPADAILATTAADRSVYVWERAKGEPMGGPGTPPTGTQTVCEGYLVGNTNPGPGGVACGPISRMAETGAVSFGQARLPGTHTLSSTIVTALVPNGVNSITLTDANGSSYKVPVTNNVVSVEDDKLAPAPAAAVSYTLPDGQIHSSQLPTPEA